jgi:hypothetical protein
MLGRRPIPFAALTSPVSVLPGDPQLRDAPTLARDGGGVAS